MSVAEFINYLQYEKRYSVHTVISYRKDLSQFVDYIREEFDLDEGQMPFVKHYHIRSWIVKLLEGGMSSRSVNRKLSSLKSFYKYLLRKGTVKKSPLIKVISPKQSKRLPVFVESDGIDKLFNQIEFPAGVEGLKERLILEVLYSTGMRLSELINIKQGDIDFHQRQVKILGKRNKERIVPLGEGLLKKLKEYLSETKEINQTEFLFFSNKQQKLYPKYIYRQVKKYLDQITTVSKRSPHVLRHTFATHLSNNGAELNSIKELLGHANLAATQVYTHNSIEKLKNVYRKAHPKA